MPAGNSPWRHHFAYSEGKCSLSFDFGILKLKATAGVNLRAREIVLFTGVLSTPQTLGDVQFEMPQQIMSTRQCAAWIVWHLDQYSEFQAVQHVGCVEEGRAQEIAAVGQGAGGIQCASVVCG